MGITRELRTFDDKIFMTTESYQIKVMKKEGMKQPYTTQH